MAVIPVGRHVDAALALALATAAAVCGGTWWWYRYGCDGMWGTGEVYRGNSAGGCVRRERVWKVVERVSFSRLRCVSSVSECDGKLSCERR
eukprot:6232496-Prymnesium_polylepis.4